MTVDEVVDVYLGFRSTESVADAAAATLKQCSITPSYLVDTFSAAQLNILRPAEEAAALLKHRNELLAHFNS